MAKGGIGELTRKPPTSKRIRGRAIRHYRGGEHKNSPSSFNFAPTYTQSRLGGWAEDYYKKVSVSLALVCRDLYRILAKIMN